MKKILALVLAFAMLAAVLAGCASSTDTKTVPYADQRAEAEKERRTLWAVSVLLLQTRLSAQV